MYIVTGIKSGLGRFLHEQFQGIGYSRGDSLEIIRKNATQPFEAIIHCAFNVNRGIHSLNFQSYIQDNLGLLQQLLAIPHRKFIFVSSADVYPKADKIWQENDEFLIEEIENLYGLMKITAEAMISNQASNYLILRPTALLGKYSRPNSLIRILLENNIKLTLSSESTFNYILHEDVMSFIKVALQQDLQGVFNLAADNNILLKDVEALTDHHIHFGSYVYNTAQLNNQKAKNYCPVFAMSSLENIKRFQMTMEEIC